MNFNLNFLRKHEGIGVSGEKRRIFEYSFTSDDIKEFSNYTKIELVNFADLTWDNFKEKERYYCYSQSYLAKVYYANQESDYYLFKFKDLKKYWEENGYFYPWKKQWDYTRKYVTPVFLPEDNTDFSITKYEDEDVVKNINIIFNKLENGEKISAFDYENKLSNKLYFSEEHCKLINYARTEIYNATMINIYKENSMEPGSSYKYDYCLSLEINADEETKTFKLDRSYKCKFVIDNKICINIGSFLKMMSEHEEKNIYVMLNVLEYWLRNSVAPLSA